jgi:transposase
MSSQELLILTNPEATASDRTWVPVNAHCALQGEGDRRVLTLRGLPIHTYAADDRTAEAWAMVSLVRTGAATQAEVARAFGCCTRTVRRHERRYEQSGMAGLGAPAGRPPGAMGLPRLLAPAIGQVRRWKEQGVSNRQIARRLGVCEKSIRNLLRRAGWARPEAAATQLELTLPGAPDRSAPSGASPEEVRIPEPTPGSRPPEPLSTEEPEDGGEETPPLTFDHDPAHRDVDRLLARRGLIDDAAPLFAQAGQVRGAGVLLALPALVAAGVLPAAQRIYGPIGPAFYGLRSTLLTLLFMALLRIGRPEALKEHVPTELGLLLGLDRAPEVKTLRRKLQRLAERRRAEQFGAELARLRAARLGAVLGFLYVDGHVRVYHGKHRLPYAHVARMRLSMPGTTDYWVNDRRGDPLFVVTAPANAGLVRMLPDLLQRCRPLVGKRRTTVVFDRGGYSPKLFLAIREAGFDLLTYHKGPFPPIDEQQFHRCQQRIDGRAVDYWLHDQEVLLLDGQLRLRQVTRLKDGHQTPILTSRFDLTSAQVAYRMFERWRQENFFKYMRQEFLLDALVDYQVEPDDPERLVPNPERKQLDRQITEVRSQLARLAQDYGSAALTNPESQRPTMRGFKIAHGALAKEIRTLQQRLDALLAHRATAALRIPAGQATKAAVLKLAPERKRLTDLIKMVAYQTESDLLATIRPHYARADDEGRTLVQNILAGTGDIEVTATELRIRLAPLSSPHRTRVLAALCEELDRSATVFPGSRLTLRFSVQGE